jgi:hypothetical protein
MFRVRFHLGAGKNYMHWQIKDMQTKEVFYRDPKNSQLELIGCRLVNNTSKAKKVFAAGKKDVCGWVECEEIICHSGGKYLAYFLERLHFNPILNPNWRRESDDGDYVWDNAHFNSLLTDGKTLRVLEEISQFA